MDKVSHIISHLMFADDLLLFGKATIEQIERVNKILKKFCDMPGQRINKEKTKVFFSKNTAEHTKRHLTHASGFRETRDLGKYLGIPLTGKTPRRKDYQLILDHVKTKLESWKSDNLSFAGRITLVKR